MCLSCPLPLISSFVSHAPPHLFKICLSGPGRRSLLEGLGEVVTPFLPLGSPETIQAPGKESGGLLVPLPALVTS